MRIQQACLKTGLTKKAIHFYIEEGLLNPNKEVENGYYNLSSQELEILQLISLFRCTGVSIQTMKEIFSYPTMTNFFMHRQFNMLKQQLNQQLTQLENISTILDVIPPNAQPFDVQKMIHKEKLVRHPIHIDSEALFPNTDARMIAILLLAPFMEIEVNEYRKYLWDKISADLKSVFNTNLVYLQRLIYSLSPEDIQLCSTTGFQLYFELSNAKDCMYFRDYLLAECQTFVQDDTLKQLWELLYEPVLRPSLLFYQSCSVTLMQEFNQRYSLCMTRMSSLLKECTVILKSEQGQAITSQLPPSFIVSDELYSDLFLLFTFRTSIFTCCSIAKTKNNIVADLV